MGSRSFMPKLEGIQFRNSRCVGKESFSERNLTSLRIGPAITSQLFSIRSKLLSCLENKMVYVKYSGTFAQLILRTTELFTVSDAILLGGQTQQILQ